MSGPGFAASGPPLAILCGAGAFPLEVASEARRAGREPFLVGVVGATDSAIEAYPHVWVRMGEVGKLFAALHARANHPSELVREHVAWALAQHLNSPAPPTSAA